MLIELKYRPKVECGIIWATQSVLLNKWTKGLFPGYDYDMQKSEY